jgi:hypothetical protein
LELEEATKKAGTLDLINENSALKTRIASLQSENNSLKDSSSAARGSQFTFAYDGGLLAAGAPDSLMSPISAGSSSVRSGSFESFPLFGGRDTFGGVPFETSAPASGYPLTPYGRQADSSPFFQGNESWRENSADREIDNLLNNADFGG